MDVGRKKLFDSIIRKGAKYKKKQKVGSGNEKNGKRGKTDTLDNQAIKRDEQGDAKLKKKEKRRKGFIEVKAERYKGIRDERG